jgi:PAS domain S-box-containing protein
MTKAPPPAGWSLRTTLLAICIAAVAYVAMLGVVILTRIRPATASLREQSETVLAEFRESTQRVNRLDIALTDLWRLLRQSRLGPVPLDTLEQARQALEGLAEPSGMLSRISSPVESDSALRRILGAALRDEEIVRNVLLGAVAALEINELVVGENLLRHADSLDAPLTNALNQATVTALQQVNEHEGELADMLGVTNLVVWLWFLGGALAVPLLAIFIRRRLVVPLTQLEAGLDRLDAGELGVRLPVARHDEVGRLVEHFNWTTALLRRRAEDDARRAEDRSVARTRMVLDAALDAVVVADANGVIREWSPQAEVVFGWTRAEVLDRRIGDTIVPPEYRDRHETGIARYARTGEPRILGSRQELVALRKDGTRFPVEITITPLQQDGQLEYSAFIRDITERHRAQAALAASEERYRTAFEQAAVGMVELDLNGCYLRVNRAFTDMVGRPAGELIGRHFAEITHPEDRERDEATFARLLEGEPVARRQKRYLRGDGGMVTVNLTSALVKDHDGRALYALTVVQDVTAQIRLEEQLRQAHKMDAVGQLAGGVAHDFNNILTAIIGFADLLRRTEGIPVEVKEDAASILATAERGAGLARNLLTLSRAAPPREEGVDLHEVVAEVRDIATRTFDRRIAVRVDVGAAHPLVTGDRSLLVNALLNLALNARDAMPRGGQLTIRTRDARLTDSDCERLAGLVTPGNYVAISVADTGSGMPSDVQERIFEPFFTTKPIGKGTGIGLAMVYGTVRSHGGAIEVHSSTGQGTEFSVFLPVRANAASRPSDITSEIQLGTGTILLADDEGMVRDVAARMLRRLGYQVEVVHDGAEAAERVNENPAKFDLVILDGNMPRMTGREAAALIRETAPALPMLLATGYLQPGEAVNLERSGFTAAIAKPYNLSELSHVVANQLRRNRKG